MTGRPLLEQVKRQFKQDAAAGQTPLGTSRDDLARAFDAFVRRRRLILKAADTQACVGQLFAEIAGYGPLEELFADETVTEVMINGHEHIYVERRGQIEPADAAFADDAAVINLAERMLGPLGLRVDESAPYADGRLPDGSRINVVIPPLAVDGPVLTVRRFPGRALTAADLLASDTVTNERLAQLGDAVRSKKSLVISGGTGSGKTTLLNVLASFIGDNERVITIEDTAELRLAKPHVVRLQSRPSNIEGRGEVSIRDLVRNALRMRPDRLIVGEVRGPEALDMAQAMNTGHEGSLSTVHANSCADALRRLEVMVLTGGVKLPLPAVRDLLTSAIDLVVQTCRDETGARRVTHIYDVKQAIYV
jgi:pilus assembly protein CpaF